MEYVILVGVVALLAIQAFADFGKKVDTTMHDQALNPAQMGL